MKGVVFMEKYFVADSYEGFELIGNPFEKAGKMYSKARQKCDRCVKGIYVSRVENGHIVPHPNCGGVCFACGGTGFITKEIRLYTEKEKTAATRAKERAAERKVEQRLAAADTKKLEWLKSNDFTADGFIYVYVGSNSFDVKDQLKENGWKYSQILGWKIAELTDEEINHYGENNIAKVSVNDLAAFNLYGEGCWLSTAKNFVDQIRNQRRPQSKSEWIGLDKERIKNIPVTVKNIRGCETRYGWTHIITFLNGDNILVWFTSTDIKFAVGESCYLTALIKEHKTYLDEKQTVITRAKLSKERI